MPKNDASCETARGFTLIELLVVLAILGILASIAVIGYIQFLNSARTTVSISILGSFRNDIEAYKMQYGQYPPGIDFTTFTDTTAENNLVAVSLSITDLHSKISSWESYTVFSDWYNLTARAIDKEHTVLLVTPNGVTRQ